MNYYGATKADAEQRGVLRAMPSAFVVRSSAFFGPWDEYNFVGTALRELQAERRFRAAADVAVSPTYVPDLVNLCLDLLMDEESVFGIWLIQAQFRGLNSQSRRQRLREFQLIFSKNVLSAI